MNWGGKIVGGALGMLALGPVGAAIGAFLGHQFDSGALGGGMRLAGGGGAARVNALFFPTTFRVMGHIAKADGRVSEREIASARSVMQALHLDAAQVQAAIGYFEEGKQPGFDLDAALRPLVAALGPYPDVAYFFLEIQLQAALAGDGLTPAPRLRLQRVAQLLGISEFDYARLENILRGSYAQGQAGHQGAGTGNGSGQGQSRYDSAAVSVVQLEQAYSVLGVESSSADAEVVKAYRRQMSRHHPDKLRANGLPDSMLERAKERTQQIQAAYERVREARGMSR